MNADGGAEACLGGAVSEHADADAKEQVQAIHLLCAAIAVEVESARRDDLGRDGLRRVFGLVQQLDQANLGVRSALEAAADRAAAKQSGELVVGVWDAARNLETAVTVGTAVFTAFTTGISDLASQLRPQAARALNTQHLRELVAQGVAARTAAKTFLAAMLLQTPAPTTAAAAGLAVRSAGAMGQGLFAIVDLAPGTIIGEYKGEVLDAAELGARYPARTDSDYVRFDHSSSSLCARRDWVLSQSRCNCLPCVCGSTVNASR